MITDAEARQALTDNLGGPSPNGRYRTVAHDRAIASLVEGGASEAQARAALLAALQAMGGYVAGVDTTGFGGGREAAEVWWIRRE